MAASGARRLAGRLAVVAVLSGLLLPFGSGLLAGSAQAAQATAPVAKPAKGSSWKTMRTEEFTGSALPSGCTAYTSKYTAGSNAWTSKEVDVSDGLLKLKLEKRKTSGKPYTSGGMACLGWAQKYGRYEVRAKVPVGKGIDSTIALWPSNPKQGAWTGLEVLAPGPDTAYVTNGYSTKFERDKVDGDYSGAFHDYVIEWSPKQVRMTVDGKQVFYSTHSFSGSRWFAIVMSNGDQLTGVPDASTTLPARFQIDSVKVSSYTGVPPKSQPIPTPTVSPSAAAGLSTVVPSPAVTSPAPRLPAAAATKVTALRPVSATDTSPSLAGGVWPWLLGGSLIAACAIASLNYPGYRRNRQSLSRR
jgi:beta-glucanase (GH16 family)